MGIRGQIKLFRFAGIQVYLHWSWFVVALIEIQWRNGLYSSPVWNVLEYLTLFAIVTTHEFGHALACRSVGGTPNRILLWPFGGVAFVDPPQRPGAYLWTLAAGPLVNVALLPLLWLLNYAVAPAVSGNVAAYLKSVEWINLGLLIFNILPVYPLDGGQILRGLLWYPLGRARSLMVATVVGLFGTAGLILLAAYLRDGWLAAITLYVGFTCWNGLQQARVLWRISKLPRRDGLACPSCGSAPPIGTYWRCARCGNGLDAFVAGSGCPHCGQPLNSTTCVDCGRSYPLAEWRHGAVQADPALLSTRH